MEMMKHSLMIAVSLVLLTGGCASRHPVDSSSTGLAQKRAEVEGYLELIEQHTLGLYYIQDNLDELPYVPSSQQSARRARETRACRPL